MEPNADQSTRSRPRANRQRRWPGAAIAAVLFLAPPGACAQLLASDLLVSDDYGRRILRVDTRDGHVEVFSPPSGGDNLLIEPEALAYDPERRRVLVVDAVAQALIAIDPDTGAQAAIAFFSFAPYGLALASRDWGGLPGREIYVSGLGVFSDPDVIVRLDGPIGAIEQTPVLEDADRSFARIALVENASGPTTIFGRMLDCDVPIGQDCSRGIGYYDLAGGGIPTLVLGDPSLVIDDVEIVPGGGDLYSVLFVECDPIRRGVYALLLGIVPISTGGLLDCPDAVAFRRLGSRYRIYVAEGCGGSVGCTDGRIVTLNPDGAGGWDQSPLAMLPVGTFVADVETVPEPGGALVGWAAVVACAWLRARRRAAGWRRGPGVA